MLRIEEPGPDGFEVLARILLNRQSIAMLQDALDELDRKLLKAEDGPSDEQTWAQAEGIAGRKERARRELSDGGRA